MYLHSTRTRAPRRILACLLLLLPSLLTGVQDAAAQDAEEATPVYGWLEWAALEPQHVMLKAKLDSGARTSSLSAVEVERFNREDEDWVRFVVPISAFDGATGAAQRIPMERPLQREALIKRHGASPSVRPVVLVDICLGGHVFTTPVTLTDRSRFNYPLLLGRSALRGRAAIDVAQTYVRGMAQDSCAPSAVRPANAGKE